MSTITSWDFHRHGFAESYGLVKESQGDYNDCETISDALARYIQILEQERAIGLKLEPDDIHYFAEEIECAKLLTQLWEESEHDSGNFLELVALQSFEMLEEYAHILVSSDFNELCF
jgi:hypothetical protein